MDKALYILLDLLGIVAVLLALFAHEALLRIFATLFCIAGALWLIGSLCNDIGEHIK